MRIGKGIVGINICLVKGIDIGMILGLGLGTSIVKGIYKHISKTAAEE